MVMTNHEIISTLNYLILTCKDGEKGYRSASQAVNKTEYKLLFNEYSQQREQFAGALQKEVGRLGGDPEQSGSVPASLHRGWIDIKSVVSGGDESAIISECERGEDSAVKAYLEMLKRDLPSDLGSIVKRQYAEVQKAHDRIRSLEKAFG